MYESKRDETQKLLKNKDTKMKEINSVSDSNNKLSLESNKMSIS